MPKVLETTIDAVPAKLGRKLLVHFTVANRTAKDLLVLTWNTPLEGMASDCLDVLRNGRRLQYDGILVKRGAPTPEAYVRLKGGESISTNVDLSSAYPIDETGDYILRFRDTLKYIPATVEAKRLKMSTLRTKETAVSAQCKLSVSTGATPRLTSGQKARLRKSKKTRETPKSSNLPKSSPSDPAITGGSNSKKNDSKTAFHEGYEMIVNASGNVETRPELYDEWFGTRNVARAAKVVDNFQSMQTKVEDTPFTLNLTGSGCQPGWYAYTHHGDTQVWLCDAFWSAPRTGIDCKAGTIVHELSHAVAETDDREYGQKACRKLAVDDPDSAIDNADSHEYFAEAEGVIYQLCIDGSIWRYKGTGREWDKIETANAVAIAANGANVYQLCVDGSIWKYRGSGRNWRKIETANAVSIAADGNDVYQLCIDGSIWRYKGTGREWDKIETANAVAIAVSIGNIYQLCTDGSIWTYKGSGQNWKKIETVNARSIAADCFDVYQLCVDGSIWAYKGSGLDWKKIESMNAVAIAASGGNVYQLCVDGAIKRYSGSGRNWITIETRNAKAIAAFRNDIVQLCVDGSIWAYKGSGLDWKKIESMNAIAVCYG